VFPGCLATWFHLWKNTRHRPRAEPRQRSGFPQATSPLVHGVRRRSIEFHRRLRVVDVFLFLLDSIRDIKGMYGFPHLATNLWIVGVLTLAVTIINIPFIAVDSSLTPVWMAACVPLFFHLSF
jgi:hypothetical protein